MLTRRIVPMLMLPLLASCQPPEALPPLTQHDDLVEFFAAVDSLARPTRVNGVPDYTREAMAAKFDTLRVLQREYLRFDTAGWGVDEKIDYRMVGAPLAVMEFNHRIMKRWSRYPVFYAVIGWWNPTMEESYSLPAPPIHVERL